MIRKAELRDVAAIARIYSLTHDREEAGETSIGWIRSVYPTAETAENAVRAGEMFVCEENGEIVSCAIINKKQVDVYADAAWKYPDAPADEVMVLHTLVVDPGKKGQGFGPRFVAFYEEYALQNGCKYLRMDTNEKNAAARRLYARLGYWEADVRPCVFNGIPGVRLVCLEKYLG